MARLRLSVAVLLAVCAAASALAQAPQSLYVDRSGSMRPYFGSGLIRSILDPLRTAVGGPLAEYAFSTEVAPVPNLDAIDALPFGNLTYLDRVITSSERQHTPISWIITDNIEDTGEAGNTERFYAALRGAEVRRVTVFPILSAPGHPGLLVYALLFDPASDAVYERTLTAFARSGAGVLRTQPLRMKPVDRDTVEVTSRSLAPLTRRGGPKVYDTGTPIVQAAEVRFKSRFDHIEIVDSALRVLDAAPSFGPGSLLEPERRQLAITPDRIRALLPGDETTQVYKLSVDLGKLSLKHNPAAWWKAAWGASGEEAALDLKLGIDVPQQNFRLTPRFLNQYSASTVEAARATGKVYAIDRLLADVNGAETLIQVDTPLYFRVNYPAWPAVLFIGLFVLALAVLAGLVLFGRRLLPRRRREWTVAAEAIAGYPLSARMDGDRVLVEGENVARIEKDRILPVAPARFEGGAGSVAIEPGKRIRLNTRRNEMDLIFTERLGTDPAAAGPTSASSAPAGLGRAPGPNLGSGPGRTGTSDPSTASSGPASSNPNTPVRRR